MTLEITHFGEDTLFSEDTLFGYSLTGTFRTDAQDDIDNILLNHGDIFTVIRENNTTDSMGDVKRTTDKTFNVYAVLQDISRKDRQILEMGYPRNGEIKGFFKPVYYLDNTTGESVVEGDIVEDRNGEYWRLVEMVGRRYLNNTEVFRVFVLRNINNEATTPV